MEKLIAPLFNSEDLYITYNDDDNELQKTDDIIPLIDTRLERPVQRPDEIIIEPEPDTTEVSIDEMIPQHVLQQLEYANVDTLIVSRHSVLETSRTLLPNSPFIPERIDDPSELYRLAKSESIDMQNPEPLVIFRPALQSSHSTPKFDLPRVLFKALFIMFAFMCGLLMRSL